MKKLLILVCTLAVCVVLLFHNRGSVGSTQSVSQILANAPHLIGKDITVTGVAGNSFAMLGVGGFQIKGEDGSTLTVVSSSGVPLEGTHVTIHGVLRQAYASGTSQKLMLVEDTQGSDNQQSAR